MASGNRTWPVNRAGSSSLHQFTECVPDPSPSGGAAADATLTLPFARRQKARQRATLDSGEAVAVLLPRGTVMRGGDRLVSTEGRTIIVVAASEPVSTVRCGDPRRLARIAYHLGNRHVAVQVGGGWLRYLADHVLDDMVLGLGATAERESAPFEPEAGAYGRHDHGHAQDHAHGHSHHRDDDQGQDQGQDHDHRH